MQHPRLCGQTPQILETYKRTAAAKGVPKGLAQSSKLWSPGETIRWYSPDHQDIQQIVRGFDTWQSVCNINFERQTTPSDAQIRVGFEDSGSWSYIGTDATRVEGTTINFGWPLENDFGTVLHEQAHLLAMQHEHQSPNRNLSLNRANIVADLAPQGWAEADVESNIIDLVDADIVTDYDTPSITHYGMPARWIDGPEPFASRGIPTNHSLSDLDIEWAQRAYPDTEPQETYLDNHIYEYIPSGIYSASFTVDVVIPGRYTVGLMGSGPSQITVLKDGRYIDGATNFGAYQSLNTATLQLDGGEVINVDLMEAQQATIGLWL